MRLKVRTGRNISQPGSRTASSHISRPRSFPRLGRIHTLMQQKTILIESLDMEGRGVGHAENEDGSPGKVIFVEGALPGERVEYQSYRRKPKWEAATLTALHNESSLRVRPKCVHFGTC